MSDSDTKQLPKDLAAETGMVNVQIDGNWIQVPRLQDRRGRSPPLLLPP